MVNASMGIVKIGKCVFPQVLQKCGIYLLCFIYLVEINPLTK
jgi:hypothetical protein